MTQGWPWLTDRNSGTTWPDSQEGTEPFEEAETLHPHDAILGGLVDRTELFIQLEKALENHQHSPKAQPEFPQRRKGL